jgi:hypothetical protein
MVVGFILHGVESATPPLMSATEIVDKSHFIVLYFLKRSQVHVKIDLLIKNLKLEVLVRGVDCRTFLLLNE